MSEAAKKHSDLQTAVVSVMARQRQHATKMQDATAESIFALALKRELVPADVPGLGRVYHYSPISVSEKDAYQKHMKIGADGSVRISMDGMVDGIIARVRNGSGQTLFKPDQRNTLLAMDAEALVSIWAALGHEQTSPLSTESLEAAEKK